MTGPSDLSPFVRVENADRVEARRHPGPRDFEQVDRRVRGVLGPRGTGASPSEVQTSPLWGRGVCPCRKSARIDVSGDRRDRCGGKDGPCACTDAC